MWHKLPYGKYPMDTAANYTNSHTMIQFIVNIYIFAYIFLIRSRQNQLSQV